LIFLPKEGNRGGSLGKVKKGKNFLVKKEYHNWISQKNGWNNGNPVAVLSRKGILSEGEKRHLVRKWSIIRAADNIRVTDVRKKYWVKGFGGQN